MGRWCRHIFFIFYLLTAAAGLHSQDSPPAGSDSTPPPVESDRAYIVQWEISSRVFTNAFLTEEGLTNILIYTNLSIQKLPLAWELTQYYAVVLSNTNILTNVNTNLNETVISTNFVIQATNLSYLFRDDFAPLIDVTPLRSYEELQQSIQDYLLPPYLYRLPEQKGPLSVRISQSQAVMTDSDTLLGFDQDLYDLLMYREKNKRMTFTPEEAQHLTLGFEEWDTKIVIRGNINLRMGYGLSRRDENNPVALPLQNGFSLNQLMKVNVTGWFGERIKVNIDQDSQRENNLYDIGFQALKNDTGILRELKVGNISLNIPQSSQYLRFSGTSENSIGIKAVLEKGPLTWQTVLNLTRTQKGYKKFTGNSQLLDISLQDYQYFKRRFFVLPDTAIDLGSLELLRFTTQTNTADRRVDGLYYSRLQEGKDYYVNLSTGELNLNQGVTRDQNLIVRYTHGGSFITTNTNALVGMDSDNGEAFLYLWRTDMDLSPWIHYGVYSLQTSDFDPGRGFTLQVYLSEDPAQQASFQFTPADYEINSILGLLRFVSLTPFPDPEGRIYSGAQDPAGSDSKHVMKIQLYRTLKRYVLDFGVVAGSERVFVNGRELPKSEYTLITALGELSFNNPALINSSDTIEVYYEYQPFFQAAQRFGIASRLDYKPSNLFNVGSTVLYGVSQRPSGGAPTIYQTPDGSFMGDIDSSLNLGRLLGLNDNWVLQLRGEYALSVLDRNTAGYALIDDFENAGQMYSMSINETRWILTAPVTNLPSISYANRGHLLYKDYRNYKLDGSYSVLTYNTALSADKIKAYSTKPGPYLALGGHLSPADYPQIPQSSLVFDYDFSAGSWVGAAINIAGPGGMDFSRYNRVVIWYKVESDNDADGIFEDTGNQEIELYLGLGQPPEDSDGDGVFDGELDRSQSGYAFNNYSTPSLTDTWVGIGRLGEGDGVIQSEDLNQNNSLDTNQRLLLLPSAQGYTDITNAVLREGDWQKLTLSVSSLSEQQRDILEHVSALSLYILQKNGTRGRVIIDEIQFKEVKWEDKRVDGLNARESTALNGELIGVFNNSFYSANRFYDVSSSDQTAIDRSVLFERLHGTRTITEALQYNESTLALDYALSNQTLNTNVFPLTGGKKASLVQYAASPFDISRYQELTFYLYLPSTLENNQPVKSGGDSWSNENFFLVLGNSRQSYYQWDLPLSALTPDQWHQVTVQLDENLELNLDGQPLSGTAYPQILGLPNLNDVDFIELGIEVTDTNEARNNGTLWVNELHVHNDDSVFGTAFYLNPRFEYRKPVWSVKNREIIGPVFLNTVVENKSVDFVNSIGGSSGNANRSLNMSLKSSFFKDLQYTINYTANDQNTETNQIRLPQYLQWEFGSRSFNATFAFNQNKDFIPGLSHTFTESFSGRLSRSTLTVLTQDTVLSTLNQEYKGTATLTYSHSLPFFKLMKKSRTLHLTPRFSLDDSLILRDISSYTNIQTGEVYLTNNTIFGQRVQSKHWTGALDIKFWKIGLNGSYEKKLEKQDQIYDFLGYRQELLALQGLSIAERYAERWASILRFTDFAELLDRQLEDRISLSMNLNRPLPWLLFDSSESFSRVQSGYSYDRLDNLTYRSDRYGFKNSWNLRILPAKAFFKSLSLKLDRSTDLSYSGTGTRIESEQALVMGGLYYRNPWYYSGLIGGLWAQTNALAAVANFSDGQYQSQNNLVDNLSVEFLLPSYNNKYLDLIPKRYTFSSRMLTARNLSSYSQSIENRAGVRFPLELARLQNPRSTAKLREIWTEVDYRNVTDFNTRQNADTLGITLRHGINFINTNFLVLVYSYTFRYEEDTYFTNSQPHSQTYGFTELPPNTSPRRSIFNNINFKASWEIRDIKRINLGFVTIKLKNSTMRNSEILGFSTQSILYQGSSFNPYDQKLFELTLEHITDYKFTEIVTGVFRWKGIMNRYASITPFAPDPEGYRMTLYDVGLGMEFSLDMSIRI